MLIDLRDLVRKYDMHIGGFIHAGAHLGEEHDVYEQVAPGVMCHWVEGNPFLVAALRDKFRMQGVGNRNPVHESLVSDDTELLSFHIANNGQSSSVLELGTHKQEHPEVRYVSKIDVWATTLDELIDDPNCNFLNLDLQGYELKALKGAVRLLEQIDYVYSEVNVKPLYIGCAMMDQIDAFLWDFGFRRMETCITPHGWGDAAYVKEKS